jgi:hypothetical protein
VATYGDVRSFRAIAEWSRSSGVIGRASSKPRGCSRCCECGIPSSFTRARRGPCSGGFATGRPSMAWSPRSSSKPVVTPGGEAAIDFTHATELGVTVAGEPFPHLLFEFVLSYSHWTWVAIAFGETFEALAAGVQGALWALGRVPAVLRSDNLSAATHELKATGGRALTPQFRAGGMSRGSTTAVGNQRLHRHVIEAPDLVEHGDEHGGVSVPDGAVVTCRATVILTLLRH